MEYHPLLHASIPPEKNHQPWQEKNGCFKTKSIICGWGDNSVLAFLQKDSDICCNMNLHWFLYLFSHVSFPFKLLRLLPEWGRQSASLPPDVARSYSTTSVLRKDETLNGEKVDRERIDQLGCRMHRDRLIPLSSRQLLLILQNNLNSYKI